jgi:alpha-glucosidase (family GH31 glycosyl hydrolase)
LGLNLALSGVPHWGTDTGGFYRVGENDPELYARWFQFSAFCSIFRGHGFVWRQHLPWSYGEEVEEICRRYLELRSRLMPYTYALAWQARAQGLPMMRPLVLNYPDDPNVWDLGTQYLWGDDLLVAPVTRKCATQWTVYLPEGVWHDYWTQRAYQGPGGVTVPAPLETLPLFVRAGAIIPLGPVKQHDGDSAPDVLSLLIYPRGQGSFSLYEDDGISRAYLDGDYAITELSYRTDGESCIVSVSRGAGGTRPPSSNRRHVLQLFSQRSAREVALAGAKGGLTWWHDGTFLFVDVGAAPCSVRIDWS